MINNSITNEKRKMLITRVQRSYLCNDSKKELEKTINALYNIVNKAYFKPHLPSYLNCLIKSNSDYEIDSVIKLISDIAKTYNYNDDLKCYDIVDLEKTVASLFLDLIEMNFIPNIIKNEMMNNSNSIEKRFKENNTYIIEKLIFGIKKQDNFYYSSISVNSKNYDLTTITNFFQRSIINNSENENILTIAFSDNIGINNNEFKMEKSELVPYLNSIPMKELRIDIKNIDYLFNTFFKKLNTEINIKIDYNHLKQYLSMFLDKNIDREYFEEKTLSLCNRIIKYFKNEKITYLNEESLPILKYPPIY